ncbi:MAG TPA: glycine cleavage system protein GcvH [Parafilimonas sp.]|nr:glycine cleavage system protein GcvH [Parafilimonas sp.]
MNFPPDLKYTKDHEWLKLNDDNTATIGITDFAQSELGDVVFVDINTVGNDLSAGDVFGTIEAVKAVSDLFMPVKGKIIEVNSALNSNPELVNKDPYNEGWMAKIEIANSEEINSLADASAYEKLVS